MLKPWQPRQSCELEPVELDSLCAPTRDLLLGFTIEFVSLGYVPAGDYRLQSSSDTQAIRTFQCSDGAVLGWVSDTAESAPPYRFVSVLGDGTCVRSTPEFPSDPWSCCRFPMYVNFGSGCGLEELLVMHLTSLTELEHGCGATLKYDVSHVPDVLSYMHALMHETEYGLDAPPEALPVPPAGVVRESILQ